MEKIICLLLTFCAAVPSAWARPTETSITLMVWLDEGKAFDHRNYESSVKIIRSIDGHRPLRTLYLKKKTVHEQIEDVANLVGPDEKISNLIVATHGQTTFSKKTELYALGGFDRNGAFGEFKNLLERLGERRLFAPRLHVFLNSCSTFAGSKEAVRERAEALLRELQNYGVRDVSVWGARQPLLADDYRGLNRLQLMWRVQRKLLPPIAMIAAPFGAYLTYRLAEHGFDAEALRWGVETLKQALEAGGLIYTAANVFEWLTSFMTGTDGYLARLNNGQITVENVDLNERAARLGCEMLLVY
jgi:hypothetical protein